MLAADRAKSALLHIREAYTDVAKLLTEMRRQPEDDRDGDYADDVAYLERVLEDLNVYEDELWGFCYDHSIVVDKMIKVTR